MRFSEIMQAGTVTSVFQPVENNVVNYWGSNIGSVFQQPEPVQPTYSPFAGSFQGIFSSFYDMMGWSWLWPGGAFWKPDASTPDSDADESEADDTDSVVDGEPPEETDAPAGSGQGLNVSYFDVGKGIRSLSEVDFNATPDAAEVVGALDMYRTRDAWWDGGAKDKFAARYEGYLNVTTSGEYTIYLTSDDGSALYLDGDQVLDHDGRHSTSEKSVTLHLEAGSHEFLLDYFENNGAQTLVLEWAGPDSNGDRVTIDGDSFSFVPFDTDDDDIADGPHDHDDTVTGSEGEDTVDSGDGTDDGMDMDHGDGTDGDMEHGDGTDGDMEHGDGTDGDMDHGDGTDGDMDHGDGADGDMDHGDHGDHDSAGLEQPTTPEEEDAFVQAVISDTDEGHMMHMDDESKAMEHGQLLDLVPRNEATHIAVRDGDWFDPDTWYQGRIPDAGAKVLIPKGVSVRYNDESDDSLFTIRVDGELTFATDTDSRLLVDTLIVDTSGRLEIGTADNPIQDDVNVEIVIANNGDIDVDWDPTLLSRGVISHGQVEIHGAEKTGYTTVAEAPMAGDTEIRLAEIPDNWSVGDTIVLTGTHKTGWTWDGSAVTHTESQDEEVVITAIDGDTITIDRALTYDHDAPREDLSAYVANMSRNITFSSEDGEASEIHHRGHVMFMHNDDVDVRYAAFDDLGRTDKSERAFHADTLDPATIESDTNVQARYSFHFHKTGTEDQDNPAIAFGNAVSGSPGWGFVHHSSHAEFVQNIAFDVFGAAFVAEDGDETGLWWENMAIKSEGIGYGDAKTKSGDDVNSDDSGRTGDGFWFSGRAVEAGHNIAANTTHGFTWMVRAADAVPSSDQLNQPDAYYGLEHPKSNDQIPIQSFHDNEAFGTQVGLIVVKSSTWQHHDVRTIMDGFTNWETSKGVQLTYTSHYTLKNFDILATENKTAIARADTGFEFGPLTFDLVINGLTVEGFKTGVNFDQRARDYWTDADFGHVIIDLDASGNDVDLNGFNPDRHTIMTSDQLVSGRLEFEMLGDTTHHFSDEPHIYFEGIKTDSIGMRDRQFADDIQQVYIVPILQRDGYYETKDGEYVMFINDFVADRATGELLKFTHMITLDASEAHLAWMGGFNNGLIDLDSAAPVANDDMVSTAKETPIVIDVLANDSDPDGDALEIDGFTNPFHANLTLQEDGTLLYQPHANKVGTDSFDYWVTDDNGVLSQATVVVEIFDL